MTWALRLLPLLPTLLFCACQGGGLDTGPATEVSAEAPVGSAQDAVSTPVCLTLRRGADGDAFDAYLAPSNGHWASGGYPMTWTGGATPHYSVHAFDLSPVPPGAAVVSAVFSIHVPWSPTSSSVRAHRVTTPWTESGVTWGSFGDTAGYDPAILGAFDPLGGGTRTVDVTTVAAGWVSGAVANHGLLLEEDPGPAHAYLASEAGNTALRPALTLCYGPGGPCAGKPEGEPCDDGDPCTLQDACSAGVCAAGSVEPDGTLCGPSLPEGSHVCNEGTCTFDPQISPAHQHFTAGCGAGGTLKLGAGQLAAHRHKNWVIHTGCTVELGVDETLPLSSLVVENGGTLTHAPCTASGCSRVEIDVASTVDVQAGGRIHGDGRGYLGGLQPGNPSPEGRSYAGTTTKAGCDGAHGGTGLQYEIYGCKAPAVVYDEPRDPRFPGGGGYGYDNSGLPGTPSYPGLNGGGVVRIHAAGTVTLNGTISVNGGVGGVLHKRGGAGGSVRIDAPLVTRSSPGLAITANGSMAAGGGRVALHGARGGALSVLDEADVQARGGPVMTCAGGASGTIYAGPLGAPAGGDLLIEAHLPGCAGASLYDAPESTYDLSGRILAGGGGAVAVDGIRFTPHALAGRTMIPDVETGGSCPVLDNDEDTLFVDSSCPVTPGKVFRVDEPPYDALTIRGPHRVRAVRLSATQVSVSGTVNGPPAKLTTHGATSSSYSSLTVLAADMTLGPNAQIDVNGKGYLGAWQGDNLSDYGMAVGNVPWTGTAACIGQHADIECSPAKPLGCCKVDLGNTDPVDGCETTASHAHNPGHPCGVAHVNPWMCGASHGGQSGDTYQPSYTACLSSCTIESAPYGDDAAPSLPGGGGAGLTTYPSLNLCKHFLGSNGGGVVRLAITGTFTLGDASRIAADASPCPGWWCSGGAGGSIWVDAAALVSTAGAQISARGAFGISASSAIQAGNGGGGRVSISTASPPAGAPAIDVSGGDDQMPYSNKGEAGSVHGGSL